MTHSIQSERIHLHKLHRAGHTITYIGWAIGKDKYSVSQELRRNRNADGSYNAMSAHRRALQRRGESRRPIRMEDPTTFEAVSENLVLRQL
ncbi:MAG: hypothetical protein AAGJ40_17285 [Planctomycetota bacterium]